MTTFTLNTAKGDTLAKWARTAPPPGVHLVYCEAGDHGTPTFVGRAHTLVQVVCRPGAVIRGALFRNTKGWLFRKCLFEAAGPVGPGNFVALVDTDDKSSDITFGTTSLDYGCEFRACQDVGALSVPEKLALHHTLVRLRGPRMVVAFSRLHDCRNVISLMGVGARAEDNVVERFTVDAIDVGGSCQRVLRNEIRDGRHFPEEELHADGIQLQDATATDVLIEGNVIGPSPQADYLQGITGFDGRWDSVKVLRNTVTACSSYEALSFFGVDKLALDGNVVTQQRPTGPVPWLRVVPSKTGRPSTNLALGVNFAPRVVIDPTTTRAA